MRVAPVLTLLVTAPSWAGEAFGLWKLDPARSTGAANQRSVTLRIEPHTRVEVFTLDTVAADGRASTSSTILNFDSKARAFQNSDCSGTQSSRRKDSRTVEILRECANGGHRQLIQRSVRQPGVLILVITDERPNGHRSEQRLVLEKQ